jgi:hypothetical protein
MHNPSGQALSSKLSMSHTQKEQENTPLEHLFADRQLKNLKSQITFGTISQMRNQLVQSFDEA